MFKSLRRKSFGEKALYIFVSMIFMAVALSYIYILVWSFISACKTHTEIVMDPFSLPKKWNFSNFIEVFTRLNVNGNGFGIMLFNSIWFSVMGTLLAQFCAATFSYCATKYTFPGSRHIYTLLLLIMTLPLYGNGGAQYKLYHQLGLIDNYFQIITAYGAINAGTLWYMAYYKNFSNTYSESARMDGANDFQIYFRIILPQARPLFIALFLQQWLSVWNTAESVLVYLPNLPTLPAGIYQFNQEMIYQLRLDILFAACVIVVMPALILFIVFNKTLTTNVSLGGIKG